MRLARKHWKALVGILIVFVIFLSTRQVPLAQWLEDLVEPLRHSGWIGVALYAFMYFLVAMCGLPCMPLTLASGYIFGPLVGLAAIHTGAMLGASGGFMIGRRFGRARLARQLQHQPLFQFLDKAVSKEGWKVVALLRMHPIPFGLSNYLYGMTTLDFWRYFLATTLAMLPGHIIFGHLGSVGGKYLQHQGAWSPMEWAAVFLSVGSSLLLLLVMKRWVRHYRLAARDMDGSQF